MFSEAALGYIVVAAATGDLRNLLEAAVVEHRGRNPRAEEVIVIVCNLAVGCSLDCNCSVFVYCGAGMIVGQHERLVRVYDREVYSNAVRVVVEASAAVDS